MNVSKNRWMVVAALLMVGSWSGTTYAQTVQNESTPQSDQRTPAWYEAHPAEYQKQKDSCNRQAKAFLDEHNATKAAQVFAEGDCKAVAGVRGKVAGDKAAETAQKEKPTQ